MGLLADTLILTLGGPPQPEGLLATLIEGTLVDTVPIVPSPGVGPGTGVGVGVGD